MKLAVITLALTGVLSGCASQAPIRTFVADANCPVRMTPVKCEGMWLESKTSAISKTYRVNVNKIGNSYYISVD